MKFGIRAVVVLGLMFGLVPIASAAVTSYQVFAVRDVTTASMTTQGTTKAKPADLRIVLATNTTTARKVTATWRLDCKSPVAGVANKVITGSGTPTIKKGAPWTKDFATLPFSDKPASCTLRVTSTSARAHIKVSLQARYIVAASAPSTPANPGDTKNCSDFATHALAQAWFNKYFPHYGDIARLDSDHDLVACETLP